MNVANWWYWEQDGRSCGGNGFPDWKQEGSDQSAASDSLLPVFNLAGNEREHDDGHLWCLNWINWINWRPDCCIITNRLGESIRYKTWIKYENFHVSVTDHSWICSEPEVILLSGLFLSGSDFNLFISEDPPGWLLSPVQIRVQSSFFLHLFLFL